MDHVIFDVDDVLITMDHATARAAEAVGARLVPRYGEATARTVASNFERNYLALIDNLRRAGGEPDPAYLRLRARIERWQRGVTEAGFEVKQWSRDTLLAVALEDAGVAPTAAALSDALAGYWQTLTDETRLFPDAVELCDRLAAEGLSFHLATNSDGFLDFDDARNTFTYAPDRSAERKVARLGAVQRLGVSRAQITVGDPIGKPGPAYYARVVAEFSAQAGRAVDLARTLAVGDSLAADVLPYFEAGVKHGAWLQRAAAAPGLDAASGVPIVRTLLELLPLIWSEA